MLTICILLIENSIFVNKNNVLNVFFANTVKPLNSGHSRDRKNYPLLRGFRYREKLIK